MRRSCLPSRAAVATLALLPLLAVPALAQPGPGVPGPRGGGPGGYGWGPGMMMGPGMMSGGMGFMCNPRTAGMAEWRISRIEAAVKPTDAQKKALEDLRTASTKAADAIAASCSGDVPKTSAERLGLMEKRLDTMLQAIKTVRPAFDAFYATLDAGQKAKLDTAGPRRWGWQGWRWRWNER